MISLHTINGRKRLSGAPGFTLVELIIYVALTSIILVALLRVMLTVLGTRDVTRAATDLHEALRYPLDRMRRSAWNAQKVDMAMSSFNTNNGVFALTMSGSASPLVFSLSGGRVFVRDGAASALPLTPSTILVDQLQFLNLTGTGAFATVQILLHAVDTSVPTVNLRPQALFRTSVTLRQ